MIKCSLPPAATSRTTICSPISPAISASHCKASSRQEAEFRTKGQDRTMAKNAEPKSKAPAAKTPARKAPSRARAR
ncbi:hypothetical protein EN981_18120, partial [Mesorhizobium sp. M7A.F.Ca.CA.001.13.2.1]